MRYFFYFLFFGLFLDPGNCSSFQSNHTTVQLISEVTEAQPGKPFWVAVKFTIKEGFHTYWANPGDSGFATKIEWELPKGWKSSPIHWLPPYSFKEGGKVSFGYEKEAFHLTQITPSSASFPQNQKLTAKVRWLTCGGNICLPESCDLGLVFPASLDESPLIHNLLKKLPQSVPFSGSYEGEGETIHLTFPLPDSKIEEITSVTLFPMEKGVINPQITQTFAVKEGMIRVTAGKGSLKTFAPSYDLVVELRGKDTVHYYQLPFLLKKPMNDFSKEPFNFFSILFFGFLGGIILNAMPCVFPVLSIKALTIARKKKSEFHHIRLQGITYAAGVFTSFLGLALLLIFFRKAGHSIGWGFQMQSSFFIAFMIYLTFLIGLSFSGVFFLPSFFDNSAGKVKENKMKGNFFLGVLAVLVATPCTAPFMGVAIGYALTQSIFTILLVFGVLSIGFSFPYLCICFFPTLLRFLPRPGEWMETFKEFLAFPMYATVLWLFWVLVQQKGTRGLITVGSGLIITVFCLWMWRKLKIQTLFTKRLTFVFFISASLLPISYIDSPLQKELLSVEPFSNALLEKYRQDKIPVFVNITASWCITCKYNEITLKKKSVSSLFKNNGVKYLEADWTTHNTDITLFLEKFGRSGVPLYVYYPVNGDPVLLPQLLTKDILKKTLKRKN